MKPLVENARACPHSSPPPPRISLRSKIKYSNDVSVSLSMHQGGVRCGMCACGGGGIWMVCCEVLRWWRVLTERNSRSDRRTLDTFMSLRSSINWIIWPQHLTRHLHTAQCPLVPEYSELRATVQRRFLFPYSVWLKIRRRPIKTANFKIRPIEFSTDVTWESFVRNGQ